MRIAIVNYEMGNIKSISSTLKYLGVADVIISSDYEELKAADKIILPGVGSFAKAMSQIKNNKLDIYLQDIVINNKKPLLGICLGMQLLGVSSTEDGFTFGLGFVNATITKFDNIKFKVPHVGFNQVQKHDLSRLYQGISENSDFYFTHSYKMLTNEYINQSVCEYGGEFIASFEDNNIAGVQFHPELSQSNGLKLLRNFIQKF
jgi:imidazole glycerol-phosphate synthase subunit HisH